MLCFSTFSFSFLVFTLFWRHNSSTWYMYSQLLDNITTTKLTCPQLVPAQIKVHKRRKQQQGACDGCQFWKFYSISMKSTSSLDLDFRQKIWQTTIGRWHWWSVEFNILNLRLAVRCFRIDQKVKKIFSILIWATSKLIITMLIDRAVLTFVIQVDWTLSN